MSETARLTLPEQTIESAEGAAKPLLKEAKSRTGMVPNMYANMANVPGLLHTYNTGYQHFREDGLFTPPEQEVVLLTISRSNVCTYCMAAHSMLAEKVSKVAADVLSALRSGSPIPDEKLAALSTFTQILVDKRGNATEEQLRAFLAAGYSERQVLGIVLAIAVKTLSNYSNHLFHTPLDAPFRAYEWDQSRKGYQETPSTGISRDVDVDAVPSAG
jgi:uncharacterized peroxidase-related enzyme